MSIAPRVQAHLQRSGVHYDVIEHAYSKNSLQTAMFSHLTPKKLAKAVIVRGGRDFYLCLIPADHRLDMPALKQRLGSGVRLVSERELGHIFDDCVPGAIPALGQVYGMPVMWDDSLDAEQDVYLESGDHRHLIHVSHGGFRELMGLQQHDMISQRDNNIGFCPLH